MAARKTFLMAIILCVVCSLLVSGASVLLRPLQEENQKLDVRRNILVAAGILKDREAERSEVNFLFEKIETRTVELNTGDKYDLYLLKDGDLISRIVLPIFGKGVWSTMYGFISLGGDLKTITGLVFYQHGETPGLGGEIDSSRWQAKWDGKLAFDQLFIPVIKVLKGKANPNNKNFKHQVDGISGATLTGNAVQKTVHHWLGPNGFGPFLSVLREGSGK